jgi:hypothetical protein
MPLSRPRMPQDARNDGGAYVRASVANSRGICGAALVSRVQLLTDFSQPFFDFFSAARVQPYTLVAAEYHD